MDDRIRRAALSAALKTAIVVSLTGCYGMHQRTPRAAPATDGGRPLGDASHVAHADVPPDVPPLPCRDHLARLAITDPSEPGGTWAWGAHFTDEAARLDPHTGACCLELDVAASAGTLDPSVESPLAMACCDVITSAQMLVSFSSLGCTPWGPPCPPEMDDETLA